MSYTTHTPSKTWGASHSDIYDEDGFVCVSVPVGKEEETIAWMIESHQRHYRRIIERKEAHDPRLVVANGRAYSIGSSGDDPKGFGGTRWVIRFHDGREIITDSLWHLGDIPAEWRERLPDNATLREAGPQ